jgi:DNA polymerase III delta prime subunit
VLIVMAGLPGTGKSTLAKALARALPGLVLNKDQARAALFPPEAIAYSASQDDLVVHILLLLAAYYLDLDPLRWLILDGRPFTRQAQVQQVLDFARPETGRLGFCAGREIPLRFIECVCSEALARQRLERAVQRGIHPAANRDYALYRRMKTSAEPLSVPHLVVDTGADLSVCLRQCLDYLLVV